MAKVQKTEEVNVMTEEMAKKGAEVAKKIADVLKADGFAIRVKFIYGEEGITAVPELVKNLAENA